MQARSRAPCKNNAFSHQTGLYQNSPIRVIHDTVWMFPIFLAMPKHSKHLRDSIGVRVRSGYLVSVRAISPQRYSRSRAGGFGVRRLARRMHIRRRGRVLPNPRTP